MIEEWKPIVGYEGHYEISNLGIVNSIKLGKKLILAGSRTKDSYTIYNLYINGINKYYTAHRLVAIHFIDNPLNLPCVCHKDETLDERGRLYNGEDNLFWGTFKDNSQDMINKGRSKYSFQINNPTPSKGKFGKDHHSSKKVNQYTKDGEFIREWYSIIDIERELGIPHQCVGKCCKGIRKTAYGFKWKFLV